MIVHHPNDSSSSSSSSSGVNVSAPEKKRKKSKLTSSAQSSHEYSSNNSSMKGFESITLEPIPFQTNVHNIFNHHHDLSPIEPIMKQDHVSGAHNSQQKTTLCSPNSSSNCNALFKQCCGKIIEVVQGASVNGVRNPSSHTHPHEHLPSVEHLHHDDSREDTSFHEQNPKPVTLPPIHQKAHTSESGSQMAKQHSKHNCNQQEQHGHPHYEHHTSFPTPQFYKRSPTVSVMTKRCNSEPLKRSLERTIGGDQVTPKNLHISQIENYIPNITNNHAQYISVTIKVDSFVKGFEVKHEYIQHEDDVSPIVDKHVSHGNHRRKSHCTSVVVGSNLSHSFKYLDTIYVHMTLPPNSKTNIRPNSIEDSCPANDIPKYSTNQSEEQVPSDNADSCDSMPKPRRKSCNGHAKVQPVKKHYTYQIVDFKLVRPSEIKPLEKLNGEDMVNHGQEEFHSEGEDEEASSDDEEVIHIPGGVFCKTFRDSTQKSPSRPETASSSAQLTRRPLFSTFADYHYVPPKIHQILLTRKQRRNIKDMIDIINNSYTEDVESTGVSQGNLPVNFVDRLNYLLECPDSFVLVRDEAFCESLNVKDVMGLSMFGYAAKHKQYYIINELCQKQPYRVLQDIVQDIDQLEFIASLEDKRVIQYIIHSLIHFIDVEKEILREYLRGSYHHHNIDEGHLDFSRFGSVEQLESFFKNMLVRYFTFIDSVFCVEAWTQTESNPFLSQTQFIQEAITTSKPKILKYLIAEGALKCNEYCDGGTVLHWACLNRSMETIKMLLKVKTLNKGLKVQNCCSNSRLKPFQKKTAYDIGKDLFQSVSDKGVCKHKGECMELLHDLNPSASHKLHNLVGKIFSK
ncbi:hypothetical protein C9374_012827 [Naegleria lovaniensis]|uniref:Uncharacterized protein n=1 Tax=Naegleria lovaniensis TaxID=51637 RepID=A0AA88G6T3_NAELO|nr:uncharacterized protein C9374_012827 [Naegleria lovaniensis]KAG2373095.1 hypothetical protein C9374_012827 [Naegleria lovaniensis]